MLTVQVVTENAAFDGNLAGESSRILREIADRIEAGETTGLYQSVRDSSGNTCGLFRLKPCTCTGPCEHVK